ncbi:SKI family transcriptional corepressor 1 homolog-B isoform X1 [Diabrotica virgifera virgifera]|uniref:c-SKI SMAD4-binding domain-containing protein n=2 Tax=Diabrotica virgifera virgifera TaxID=50390 RepID=A0ABM5LAN4_DIAVI|nr:SKI family transcriptional corepressor 1 homolog-B isoform X1 [Diabrotica virgifera virgifera]
MESIKPRMAESPQPGVAAKKELSPKPNQFQVSTVVLYGVPIVSLVIENQERLCLAQISNTLLKQFSYNEIHNRRVALGITCVQCTPVQLEILRRAGAMPVSSRRCGMITRREAERLCKSFLGDNAPPRLPDDFAFAVHHECAWGCRGSFLPSRYNSSRAKCIKCSVCGLFFSPNKFIFHSHRLSANDKYVQPDAANFNSWRRHMKLSGSPPEEITHAWEDVKAMFNGGTRKRLLASSLVSRTPKQSKIEPQPQPIVPAPRIPNCQDIPLPISRVAMDFIYHKPLAFTSYSSFPWLKRNPILFPQDNPFFPMDKSYQSAFKPVQPVVDRPVSQKDEESDDEVDIETTDDKPDAAPNWEFKEEKVASVEPSPSSQSTPELAGQREDISAISQKIWNLSRLSFDNTDRTNFLYRQDLHRHFLIGAGDEPSSILRTSVGMAMNLKPNVDCSTCLNHNNGVFSSSESSNKVT